MIWNKGKCTHRFQTLSQKFSHHLIWVFWGTLPPRVIAAWFWLPWIKSLIFSAATKFEWWAYLKWLPTLYFKNRFLKKIQMCPKIQMQFQTGFLPHNGLLFSDTASHKALSGCLSVLCWCFCIYCMYVCTYFPRLWDILFFISLVLTRILVRNSMGNGVVNWQIRCISRPFPRPYFYGT